MRIIYALPILLASSLVSAAGVTYCSYAFGNRYAVELSKEELQRTPIWPDDAENPPLSARKAIKLADELRRKLVPDTEEYKWRRMSADIVFVEGLERCVWRVSYLADNQIASAEGGAPHRFSVFVLMDGTVIQPNVSNYRNR